MVGSSGDHQAGNLLQPLTSGLRACKGQTAVHGSTQMAASARDASDDDNLECPPNPPLFRLSINLGKERGFKKPENCPFQPKSLKKHRAYTRILAPFRYDLAHELFSHCETSVY